MYHLLSSYDFALPEERIATHPTTPRDACRLLTLERETGSMRHGAFSDIERELKKGDVLVLNDAKASRCRVYAKRRSGGKVEALLVERISDSDWRAMTSGGALREGAELMFPEHVLGTVLRVEGKLRILRFSPSIDFAYLSRCGEIPLPPYIIGKRKAQGEPLHTPEDDAQYQCVFAAHEGAAAAPTAGLHFTQTLLNRLREKGVIVMRITLYTGFGTFLPVETEDLRDHAMHAEAFSIPEETARAITDAKNEGRRVVACGTTVTRALESAYNEETRAFSPRSGETSVFIYPPYRFKCVSALITNFHTPKSTLLAMASAFAGYAFLKEAYQIAITEGYRFFSYGDAMFIQ